MTTAPATIDVPPLLRERSARWSLFVACVLGVSPFLILAWFGSPSSDDFPVAIAVAEHGALGSVRYWYNHYTGRFTALLLAAFAVDAGVMGQGYRLLAYFSIALLAGSLAAFVRMQPLIRVTARQSLAIGAALTAIHIVTMPSFVEGMCWLNGVAAYHVSVAGALMLFAMLWGAAGARSGAARAALAAGGVLLAAAVAGLNETVMIYVDLLLLAATLERWLGGRPGRALFTIALIVAAVASAASVLAPGNANRMTDLPDSRNLALSLSHSIGMTLALFFRWLANPALLGFTVLLLPWLSARAAPVALPAPRGRMLAIIVVICLAFLFCALFLSYWAKGQNAPRRMQNVMQIGHMLCWFAFVIACVAGKGGQAPPSRWAPHRVRLGIALLAIGIFGASRFPRAAQDLLHLPAHLGELAERDRLIAQQKAAGAADIVLPADSRELRTLCYQAMKVDDPAWVSESYAKWLDVRSVRVVERGK